MGGGALYDMGVYTVNGIRYASGLEPVEVVEARQFANRPELFTEVDETTTYTLQMSNGILAYGRTSVGERSNHLKVECERGHYHLEPMQSYSGVKGKRSDGILLNTYVDNQQAIQMDNDALSILTDKPMHCPGEEGMKDIHIIEGIIRSAESGRSVVL